MSVDPNSLKKILHESDVVENQEVNRLTTPPEGPLLEEKPVEAVAEKPADTKSNLASIGGKLKEVIASLKSAPARISASMSRYMRVAFDRSGRENFFKREINKAVKADPEGKKATFAEHTRFINNVIAKNDMQTYSEKYLGELDSALCLTLIHKRTAPQQQETSMPTVVLPTKNFEEQKEVLKLYLLLKIAETRKNAYGAIQKIVPEISRQLANDQIDESKRKQLKTDLENAVRLLKKVAPNALNAMNDPNITKMKSGIQMSKDYSVHLANSEIDEVKLLTSNYLKETEVEKKDLSFSKEETITIANDALHQLETKVINKQAFCEQWEDILKKGDISSSEVQELLEKVIAKQSVSLLNNIEGRYNTEVSKIFMVKSIIQRAERMNNLYMEALEGNHIKNNDEMF